MIKSRSRTSSVTWTDSENQSSPPGVIANLDRFFHPRFTTRHTGRGRTNGMISLSAPFKYFNFNLQPTPGPSQGQPAYPQPEPHHYHGAPAPTQQHRRGPPHRHTSYPRSPQRAPVEGPRGNRHQTRRQNNPGPGLDR